MPNIQIRNTSPNIRIQNTLINTRVSSFQTTRTGSALIPAGTPIGLLLSLTYAVGTNLPTFSDFRPNIRVINT